MKHLPARAVISLFLCYAVLSAEAAVSSQGAAVSNGTLQCDADCRHAQAAALLELFDTLGGPNWVNNSGWLQRSTGDACAWFGVSCCSTPITTASTTGAPQIQCSIANSVTAVILTSNNLVGTLPPNLFNSSLSSSLLILELSANELTGRLPTAVASSSALQSLGVTNNQLSGTVPTALAQLTQLRTLKLSYNRFTGTIPVQLANLTQLDWLNLRNNDLTGAVPQRLLLQPSLRFINLQSNMLSSVTEEVALPATAEVFYLAGLAIQEIMLSNNSLGGTIPTVLTFLPVETLDLSYNQLTGTIPARIGASPFLRTLLLDYNNLTGSLPQQVMRWNLETLDVHHNQLTGTISNALGSVPSLASIELSYNNFIGPLPDSFSALQGLQLLDIANTQMVQPLPPGDVGAAGPPIQEALPPWLMFNIAAGRLAILNADGTYDFMSCYRVVLTNRPTQRVMLSPSYFHYAGCQCDASHQPQWSSSSVGLGSQLTCVPATNQSLNLGLVLGPVLAAVVVAAALLLAVIFRFRIAENIAQFKAAQDKKVPPSGNQQVTLVLTDVEGSTELWEWDTELMAAAIDLHDKLLRAYMPKFFGYEVTTEGDAFLVAFHDPFDAMGWCLAVQLALHGAAWNPDLLRHPKSCVLTADSLETALRQQYTDLERSESPGHPARGGPDSNSASWLPPARSMSMSRKTSGALDSSVDAVAEPRPPAALRRPERLPLLDLDALADAAAGAAGRNGGGGGGGGGDNSGGNGGGSSSKSSPAPSPASGGGIKAGGNYSPNIPGSSGHGSASEGPYSENAALFRAPTSRALFRGLRIRMGVATGLADSIRKHKVTQRTEYFGDVFRRVHAVADTPHGGQVIMDDATFRGLHARLGELGTRVMEVTAKLKLSDSMALADINDALLHELGGTPSMSVVPDRSAVSMTAWRQPYGGTGSIGGGAGAGGGGVGSRSRSFTQGEHGLRASLDIPGSRLVRPSFDMDPLVARFAGGTTPDGAAASTANRSNPAGGIGGGNSGPRRVTIQEEDNEPSLHNGTQLPVTEGLGSPASGSLNDNRPHTLERSFTHKTFSSSMHEGSSPVPSPGRLGSRIDGDSAHDGSAIVGAAGIVRFASVLGKRVLSMLPAGLASPADSGGSSDRRFRRARRNSVSAAMVIDMGIHELPGIAQTVNLVQALPPGLEERGRYFPALDGSKQKAPGYFDAPAAPLSPLTQFAQRLQPQRALLPDVTIVFCTMEGFNTMQAINKALADEAMQLYNDCIRWSLLASGGYECQETEGAYMIAFEDAADAVEWCLAVQEVMMEINWNSAILELPMAREELDLRGLVVFRGPRVKMGVYKGMPTRVQPHSSTGRADYFGRFVNRAARYCHVGAHGGQVVVAKALIEELQRRWSSGTDRSVVALETPPGEAILETADDEVGPVRLNAWVEQEQPRQPRWSFLQQDNPVQSRCGSRGPGYEGGPRSPTQSFQGFPLRASNTAPVVPSFHGWDKLAADSPRSQGGGAVGSSARRASLSFFNSAALRGWPSNGGGVSGSGGDARRRSSSMMTQASFMIGSMPSVEMGSVVGGSGGGGDALQAADSPTTDAAQQRGSPRVRHSLGNSTLSSKTNAGDRSGSSGSRHLSTQVSEEQEQFSGFPGAAASGAGTTSTRRGVRRSTTGPLTGATRRRSVSRDASINNGLGMAARNVMSMDNNTIASSSRVGPYPDLTTLMSVRRTSGSSGAVASSHTRHLEFTAATGAHERVVLNKWVWAREMLVYDLGEYRFKGIDKVHRLVSVTTLQLAGRTFPSSLRKGKGERVKPGAGLIYTVQMLPASMRYALDSTGGGAAGGGFGGGGGIEPSDTYAQPDQQIVPLYMSMWLNQQPTAYSAAVNAVVANSGGGPNGRRRNSLRMVRRPSQNGGTVGVPPIPRPPSNNGQLSVAGSATVGYWNATATMPNGRMSPPPALRAVGSGSSSGMQGGGLGKWPAGRGLSGAREGRPRRFSAPVRDDPAVPLLSADGGRRWSGSASTRTPATAATATAAASAAAFPAPPLPNLGLSPRPAEGTAEQPQPQAVPAVLASAAREAFRLPRPPSQTSIAPPLPSWGSLPTPSVADGGPAPSPATANGGGGVGLLRHPSITIPDPATADVLQPSGSALVLLSPDSARAITESLSPDAAAAAIAGGGGSSIATVTSGSASHSSGKAPRLPGQYVAQRSPLSGGSGSSGGRSWVTSTPAPAAATPFASDSVRGFFPSVSESPYEPPSGMNSATMNVVELVPVGGAAADATGSPFGQPQLQAQRSPPQQQQQLFTGPRSPVRAVAPWLQQPQTHSDTLRRTAMSNNQGVGGAHQSAVRNVIASTSANATAGTGNNHSSGSNARTSAQRHQPFQQGSGSGGSGGGGGAHVIVTIASEFGLSPEALASSPTISPGSSSARSGRGMLHPSGFLIEEVPDQELREAQ